MASFSSKTIVYVLLGGVDVEAVKVVLAGVEKAAGRGSTKKA